MRFYIVFTIVFMLMLAVCQAQARRQIGLSRRVGRGLLCLGLAVSLVLASTRAMPDSWPLFLATPIWWLGYGLFALVAYLFLFEVLLFCAELAGRFIWPDLARFCRSPRALYWALALTGLVGAYGTYELDNLRVMQHSVVSAKVRRPVRLVAISDVHLGAMTFSYRVDALVALIKAQNPDVLLLVGDMVNDHPPLLRPLAEKFAAVRPQLGTFAVFGNHEFYEGEGASARVLAWTGAELLRNRGVSLPGAGVQLLGVDDPGRARDTTAVLSAEIFSLAPLMRPEEFHVLLNHRPQAWDEAARPLGIDVMLSGHTHRGQLFPFHLLVSIFTGYMGGWYEKDGALLGVSGGAGFWGPPLRVLAPPDILVLDLLPAQAKGQ